MQIIYDSEEKHNNYCSKTKEKTTACSSLISECAADEATDKKTQSDNYEDYLGLSDI